MEKRTRPVTDAELCARAKRRYLYFENKWLIGVQRRIGVWNTFLDSALPLAQPAPPLALPTIWYHGQEIGVDQLLLQPEFCQAATPSLVQQQDDPTVHARELDDQAPPAHVEEADCFGDGDDATAGGCLGVEQDICEHCFDAEEETAAALLPDGGLRCPCGCGGISARALRAVERDPQYTELSKVWREPRHHAPPALRQPGLADGLTSWYLAPGFINRTKKKKAFEKLEGIRRSKGKGIILDDQIVLDHGQHGKQTELHKTRFPRPERSHLSYCYSTCMTMFDVTEDRQGDPHGPPKPLPLLPSPSPPPPPQVPPPPARRCARLATATEGRVETEAEELLPTRDAIDHADDADDAAALAAAADDDSDAVEWTDNDDTDAEDDTAADASTADAASTSAPPSASPTSDDSAVAASASPASDTSALAAVTSAVASAASAAASCCCSAVVTAVTATKALLTSYSQAGKDVSKWHAKAMPIEIHECVVDVYQRLLPILPPECWPVSEGGRGPPNCIVAQNYESCQLETPNKRYDEHIRFQCAAIPPTLLTRRSGPIRLSLVRVLNTRAQPRPVRQGRQAREPTRRHARHFDLVQGPHEL